MLQLLNSLSLGSGALIVAIASAVLGMVFAHVRWPLMRWALVLLMPYGIANSLYWSPVWVGHLTEHAEYGAWWGAFVIPWYAAGLLASATGAYTSARIRRGRERRGAVR